VKRSKLISKVSQLPASSAVKEKLGVINSMSDGEQEEEGKVMSDGSCSPERGGGEEGGMADLIEGSAASNGDLHHQDDDYSDEEIDSDGEGSEERNGSHDGAEFTTAAADDDIDTSVAAAGDSSVGAGAGVKKVKIPGLYKPPTHDELQTLKETQNLFKSNLIRLQVRLDIHN
jgi:hypothetical protein